MNFKPFPIRTRSSQNVYTVQTSIPSYVLWREDAGCGLYASSPRRRPPPRVRHPGNAPHVFPPPNQCPNVHTYVTTSIQVSAPPISACTPEYGRLKVGRPGKCNEIDMKCRFSNLRETTRYVRTCHLVFNGTCGEWLADGRTWRAVRTADFVPE